MDATPFSLESARFNLHVARKALSELDPRRLFFICLRKWRVVAGATAATAFVALFYCLIATPSYRATAKIVIDPRQQKVLASEEVLSALTSDVSAIETQVQLLTSGRVAQRVLREMRKPGLASDPAPVPADAAPFTDLEVQEFLWRLRVARKGLTYVVDVSYTAPDPREAAEIANRVARAYMAEEVQSTIDVTQRANTWLRERIKSLAPEVMAIDKAIHEYRAANSLIAVGEQTMSERGIIYYIEQLGLARATMAEAEAKLEIDRSKSSVSLQSRDAFEIAKTKVTLMERGLRALTAELVTHRRNAIQLQNLEREATATKSLYESLLKRQKETEVQQSLTNVNARLVEEALPPTYPSWPRKALLLAAGVVLGLTIGVLIVVGEEILEPGTNDGHD